jgi:MFS family permease
MNEAQQGFLGGFYYIAWAVSAPICGMLIKQAKHRVKDLMLLSFFLCILLTLGFAFIPPSWGPWGPIMIQTALGVCVGIPSNVGSVWINVFSTPDVRTSWTGAYQATMVLGAVLGYAFGTMFHFATGNGQIGGYQISLSVIVFIEVCILIMLLFFKREHFDVNDAVNRLSNVEGSQMRTMDYILTIPDILCDPGFMTGTLMMSFLFFVVRGIQYWSTIYLEHQFPYISGFGVRCSFLAVSVTAPLLGLFVGSQVGDCIGEYYENNRREKLYKNLLAADLFAVCASLCGFPALSHDYFFVVVLSVWGVLFFGAMLLPLVSTTLLEILHPTHRVVGNGFYNLMVGIIGYAVSISSLGGLAAVNYYLCWTVLLNTSWVAVVFGLLMTCYLRPTEPHEISREHDPASCVSMD